MLVFKHCRKSTLKTYHYVLNLEESIYLVLMRYVQCIAILSIIYCFVACKKQTSIQPTQSKTITQTIESVYLEHCSGCHGKQASKIKVKGLQFGNTKEGITKSIAIGYPELGMPAYQESFTSETIEGLASYIIKNLKEENVSQSIQGKRYSSEKLDFILEPVVSNLEKPWGMRLLPDNSILIAEHAGKLLRFVDDSLIQISGLPSIEAHGQGGLMDIELHPNYEEEPWIYFSYIKENTSSKREHTTAIGRGQLSGDQIISFEELFEALPYSSKPYHFGCRIAFDDNGDLFFGVGDRGNRDENPQALDNHCGKIHRLNDEGSIPSNNPFVLSHPEYASIYSYGHRNPQGLSLHPETREIWIHEHGPKGGDELNIPQKGKNFGWPIISYGINYVGTKFTDITHKEGMEQPVIHWTPSIAPCGLDFVEGNKYPQWENNALVGSLKFEYLERLVIKDNQVIHQEKLLEGIARVRNVIMAKDGFIYVAVETPGVIYRIVPL